MADNRDLREEMGQSPFQQLGAPAEDTLEWSPFKVAAQHVSGKRRRWYRPSAAERARWEKDANQRKLARQKLEELTALQLRTVKEGGVAAEVPIAILNEYYGRGLITAEERDHYRTLALSHQLSDGTRESQVYVMHLVEEGLIPTPVAAKALGLKPQEYSMRAASELQRGGQEMRAATIEEQGIPTIGAGPDETPTSRSLSSIISAHRNGKISLSRAYAQVRELALSQGQTQQAWAALTLNAGLPANTIPTAPSVEADIIGSFKHYARRVGQIGGALLALPEQLVLRSRAGTLTWKDVLDATDVALRGGTLQESILEKRIRELPKNPSKSELAAAILMGVGGDLFQDPLSLGWGVTRVPAQGGAMLGAIEKAVGSVGRDLSLGDRAVSGMRTFLQRVVPDLDTVAFAAGRTPGDIAFLSKRLSRIAMRDGLNRADALAAADQVIGKTQQLIRTQWRVGGQPFNLGALVRRPPTRNIEEAVRTEAKKVVERATDWVEKKLPEGELRYGPEFAELEGPLRAEAWEAGVHPPELAQVRTNRYIAERLIDLSKRHGGPLRAFADNVNKFISARGTVPQEDMAALQMMMGKYKNREMLFQAMLTQPVSDLEKAERELVGRYLGWYPRKVTSQEFAEHTGLEIGEVWQIPDAKRLELTLRSTGEYTGREQIAKILREARAPVTPQEAAKVVEEAVPPSAAREAATAAPAASAGPAPLQVISGTPDEVAAAARGEEAAAKALEIPPATPPSTSELLTQRIDLEALPPKARRIMETGDELANRYVWARQHLEANGMSLGDKGIGYLTHLAPKEQVSRTVPGSDPWFMKAATFEHPTLAEWMRAAFPDRDIPAFMTDPLELGKTYGKGMAWGELFRDLGDFASTYGVNAKGIDPNAAKVLGYTPIMTTRAGVDLGAWEAITHPSVVGALKQNLLPEGVSDWLGRQLTPDNPIIAGVKHAMRAPRMSVLNSLTFLNAQVPDQVASLLLSRGAEIGKYAPGLRVTLHAMTADAMDAASAVAPHGALMDLKYGLFRGGVGIMDNLDEAVFRPMRENVLMDGMARAFRQHDIPDQRVRDVLTELKEGGILGQGYAGYLARSEGLMGAVESGFDKLIDNTLGWGVRLGGEFEDIARGSHYAAMRFSGLSPVDAFRRTFEGFPAYGPEFQSPLGQKLLRPLMYFSTYFMQRSSQVGIGIANRPALGYALYHMPHLWREAVLTPTQQAMFETEANPYALQPQFVPWKWDWWPYSNVPDTPALQKIKEATIPTIAMRFPPLEIIGDAARLLGIGNQGDSPVQAFYNSLHPWFRAAGYAFKGDWQRAARTAFPLTSRVLSLMNVGEPPTSASVYGLFKQAGIPATQEHPPDPAIATGLKQLRDFENLTASTTGFLVRPVFLPQIARDMTMHDFDRVNGVRLSLDKPPLIPQGRQLLDVKKGAAAEGVYPLPTEKQVQAWVASGQSLNQMLATGKERAWEVLTGTPEQQATVPDLTLEDWKKAMREGKPQPISPTALGELNKQRLEWKQPAITLEQARMLQEKQVPMSLPAIRKAMSGEIPAESGYCARWLQQTLWGHSGEGNAIQMGPAMVRHGWTPVEDGVPKPGDVQISTEYGSDPNGHIGFVGKNPKTGELGLLSNYEGNVGFIPLRGGQLYRPPTTNALDILSQYPMPLPPMEEAKSDEQP